MSKHIETQGAAVTAPQAANETGKSSSLNDSITSTLCNSTASQRQRILKWLQSGKPLTTLQARNELKCCHPAMRVLELRRKGYAIGTGWRWDESQEQGRHRVAQYYLKAEGGEQ